MATRDMFNSKRLIYRAIEDTPQNLDFLHSIALDSEGFANSNTGPLVPQNKENTKKWKAHLDSCLIAVVVCLPPNSSLPTAPADERTDKTDATTPSEKTPEPHPVPIGLISLTGSSIGTAHHRSANISIDVLPEYQRKGYGSEAINWIIEWGFQFHGLHRIGIESFSHNEDAGRLYERLGFVPEQRKREAIWYNGGWSDQLGFAILESEWRERRKGN
ncbi:putative N-acetyltransferase YoaA [Cytospora mali]|uniref:N-acetyltransferase YoaA n=1 Tax=Cytospora mali TaxID=578113 RepID=A0A194V5K4_CYTMA|nr:putative N-acetyltransferase YoaA [Valsa mali var. pyri (nom. inval.)]